MSAPQFTPGPWKVFRAKNGVVIGVGDREAGGITDCGDVSTNDQGVWRSGKERDANARLIAAAPELFAELQQFVNGVETGMISSPAEETLANITHRANVALAKAQGHD